MRTKTSTLFSFLLMLSFLLPAAPIYAESVDARLYNWLHDSYRSPTMDVLMNGATGLGTPLGGISVCLVFSAYGNQHQKETAKLAFTSTASTAAAVELLKISVNRKRPEGTHSRANSSFPSGHAAGSFAAATILADRHPRYGALFYGTASIVGLSRIYLGRHYPFDVLTGALLGYVSSRLVLKFQDKILSIEF